MQSTILRLVAVCVIWCGAIAACSAGGITETPAPTSATGEPASAEPTDVPPEPAPIAAPPASFTISASVGSVDAGSLSINLASRIGSIERVQLTEETAIVDEVGAPTTFETITPSSAIRAWGEVGEAGALLAQQVQVTARR